MTPWTVAHQAPRSMGLSRQDYWSGLPCPSPGDLPDPGIKPASLMSPVLAGRFFTTSATWEACLCLCPLCKLSLTPLSRDTHLSLCRLPNGTQTPAPCPQGSSALAALVGWVVRPGPEHESPPPAAALRSPASSLLLKESAQAPRVL